MHIAHMTVQPITIRSSHVSYMQEETAEASDWLHPKLCFVPKVRGINCWGTNRGHRSSGDIGTALAVEVTIGYFFYSQQFWPVQGFVKLPDKGWVHMALFLYVHGVHFKKKT